MSQNMRIFFMGALGLTLLALALLLFRGCQADKAADLRDSQKAVSTAAKSLTPSVVISKSAKPVPAKTPGDDLAAKVKPPPNKKEEPSKDFKSSSPEGTWITPSEITYLDQSPVQKKVLENLKFVGEMKFPPTQEPVFVGMNDQSLEQYEYDTRDGGHMVQWKRSGETAVEQVTYDNGDKVTRRAPENDSPYTEVSVENQKNQTYQGVFYRNNGTVQSIHTQEGKTNTIYYYDEQGRLTDVYTYQEK